VNYESINSEEQLARYCSELAAAPRIAFDTEFVSEDTYRSNLCLVQVAALDRLAVIDAIKLRDLTPFWTSLADGSHETIVHAGREEVLFSLHAIGRAPANLTDVQLAAGLAGYEYPAGYGSLVQKILGHRPPKGETRTDWRKRPLTKHQLEYALSDVIHLAPMYDALLAELDPLGRRVWLKEEMAAWQQDVDDYRTQPRWRRVSGISGLSRKSLAIVRELWQWREEEAERRNKPVRRVLRDDLIVEMAKRATADPKQIAATRGLDRENWQRVIPEFANRIERALATPEPEQPRQARSEPPSQLNLLGQFLSSALTSICRSAKVAPSLVGTATDVRDLIAHRLGFAGGSDHQTPLLAEGWRAEVVGHLIEDLLAGKVSIRIADPHSNEPLTFEPVAKTDPSNTNPKR